MLFGRKLHNPNIQIFNYPDILLNKKDPICWCRNLGVTYFYAFVEKIPTLSEVMGLIYLFPCTFALFFYN